ncbi:hypothetical protein KM176_02130 [Pseudooceanicola sp. CBS1P-1]|uniref:Anti-sigma factor NepR domain-containing protein n=1 Tax=Pseudooceanicola albus TaxID=2692189 RepID=A0A6L7FZI0_9RHOB|nr:MULTISPECIES: NepR family anti-sigma factor [Pseudooceanicola]MBT9382646.1 hypothetical protein [Pseudooceanicola endophyticus]MXN17185.1 hypothetical protein [Pseudooceanicola albus]
MTLGHSKSSPRGEIDANLKKVFQTTLDEDIPDRFKDLLKQLKDQQVAVGSEENGK